MTTTPLKIAVLFYGHLRTFEKCAESVRKNLLDLYDCDVFMHTWSTFDHDTKTWHNFKSRNAKKTISSKIEKIKKLYRPKNLKIEEQEYKEIGFVAFKNNIPFSLFGLQKKSYSMLEVSKMIEDKYDFVLMCRPDIMLHHPFDIRFFIDKMSKEEIAHSFFITGNAINGRINELSSWLATDLLFFARPDTLRVILERFHQHVFSLSADQSFPFAPELLLTDAAKHEKKEIVILNYLYERDFEIKRHLSVFSRKGLLRFHIHTDGIRLWLLSGIGTQVFRMKIRLFSFFTIDFCLGDTKE